MTAQTKIDPERTASKAATYFVVGACDKSAATYNRAKAEALRAYKSRRGTDFAKEAAAYAAAALVYGA
jgi:hypothetical protein